MLYYKTADPAADFARYEAEQQKALDRLPICSHCRERIMDDELYDIDGTLICKDCMNDFLNPTSNYIEEPDDDWDGSEDDLPW